MTLIQKANNLIQIEYPKDVKLKFNEIHKLPLIVEKYILIYHDIIQELSLLNHKKEEKYSILFKYYKEDYEDMILNQSEIKQYIESDQDYIKYKDDSKTLENILKILEMTIQELRSIQFIAKTSLDYQKFENGLL